MSLKTLSLFAKAGILAALAFLIVMWAWSASVFLFKVFAFIVIAASIAATMAVAHAFKKKG